MLCKECSVLKRCTKNYISKDMATHCENFNKIIGLMSNSRKTIVAIAFANDFAQGGHVELFRHVALYCYYLWYART